MLRPTVMVVGVAALAAALVIVLPSPASTPRLREATYQGKTAWAWHRIATKFRVERDRYHTRLGARTRELLAFHRLFHEAPLRPPHYQQWLCIHSYEGPWNDPSSPYYGGLQFSHSTWERNGGHRFAPEADQATPLQQMWIAESAWHESGGSFSQWPQTARWCGLL